MNSLLIFCFSGSFSHACCTREAFANSVAEMPAVCIVIAQLLEQDSADTGLNVLMRFHHQGKNILPRITFLARFHLNQSIKPSVESLFCKLNETSALTN